MVAPSVRRGLSLAFLTGSITVLVTAVAWACTMPVGSTTGTPAGRPGDPVVAEGEISHQLEDVSNCGDDSTVDASISGNDNLDAECTYALGIVIPSQLANGAGGGPVSPTCHYETPQSGGASQFYTIDGNPTEVPNDVVSQNAGSRVLVGTGTIPANAGSGATVMCFYSNGTVGADGREVNNNDNGAAAATLPQPFVIL